MKDRIWGTAIIQAANADARTGLAMLDKYKTQLSPDIENKLRKSISEKEEEARVEEVLIEARKHHPDNFEAQHDFVNNAEGFSRQFKEKFRGRIKSDQAEKKVRDYEAREERRNAGFDGYWQAMNEKRYGKALKITEAWSPDDFSSEEKALAIDRTSKVVIKSNPYMEKALLWNIKIGEITNKAQLYNEPRTRNLTPASILQLKKDLNQELSEQFGYREILEDIAKIYKDSNLDSKERESPFLFFQFEFLAEIAGAEKQKKRRLMPSELRKTAENLIKLREKQTLRSRRNGDEAESEKNLDNRQMKLGTNVFSTATEKLNDKKKVSEVPEGIPRTGLEGTGTDKKDSGKEDNPSPFTPGIEKEIAFFDGLLENTNQKDSLYTTINNLKNQVSSGKNLDDLTIEELTSLKKEIESVVRERKNDIQLYKKWLDTKSLEPEFSQRFRIQIEINKYLVNRFENVHLINLKKALQKKSQ